MRVKPVLPVLRHGYVPLHSGTLLSGLDLDKKVIDSPHRHIVDIPDVAPDVIIVDSIRVIGIVSGLAEMNDIRNIAVDLLIPIVSLPGIGKFS